VGRVDELYARGREVSVVERCDREVVRERGRCNQAVFDRHRAASSTQVGKQLRPSQTSVCVPTETVQAGCAFVEPALKAAPALPAGEQQNAKAQLAEDDRVDDEVALGARQPIDDARVGFGFSRFGENVCVYEVAHRPRVSEGVGRFRLHGREPTGRRARAQPADESDVRRWCEPGEAVLADAYALDIKLFAGLDPIGFPQLHRQNDLPLG